MATIDPDKLILNIPEPNRTKSLPNGHQGEFDAIFRQAVDSTEFKGAKMESAPLVSEIRPAKFSSEWMPSANRVVDRVQELIDTMGLYQHKLIDPGATLKDIQALVQKMTSQSESLSATSNTVEGEERLQAIVNQSLTLASMEIAKFNSGYFNDG
jgi:hypothetical protein